MGGMSFLERLLNGADVEAKLLGDVAEIKRGTSITKNAVTPGEIPVIAGGRTPAYLHNASNRTGQTIVIAGSGAYAGFVSWWEQPIFVSDAFTVKPNDGLLPKYCFYWLQGIQQQLHELKSGGGVPHVYPRDVAPLQIPIPCPDNPAKSLKIQREIVRILDNFTELTAELTAELSARKKQYSHYRDQLLSFEEGGVEWKTLGEITTSIASGRNKTRSAEGAFPVYGSTGPIGFVNEAAYSGDVLLVARVGANAGLVNAITGDFDVSDNTLVLRTIDAWNMRFAFHQLTHMNLNQYAVGGGQPLVTGGLLKNLKVPLPPIEEQVRIAAILDKFDALTNSLTEGLPREIELRQKQYAYYRDLLLSFPKPEEVEV